MSAEDKTVVEAATADAESVENAEQVEKSAISDDGEKPEERAERPKKDGTQRRIDRLTREKYQMRAELDMLKGMLMQRDDGGSQRQEDGLDIDQLVEKKLAEREAQKEARKRSEKVQKIIEEVEDLVDDFDLDDWGAMPVTGEMAEAIIDSDIATKLTAYLYANPAEIKRISELPKARQAAAIGKLEAKLEAESEQKKPSKSSAPAPIKPLANAKTSAKFRSDMSLAEYAAMRGRKYS